MLKEENKRNLFIVVFLFSHIFFVKAVPLAMTKSSSADDSIAAMQMNMAATTNLKPVYPHLAGFITETLDLKEKNGIGIDIGGGPGDLIIELSKLIPNIYWINVDINPYYIQYLVNKSIENNCISQVGSLCEDVKKLPLKDNYADVIVSRGSFQFWGNIEKGFSEIYRVLKPEGNAFIGRGFPPNLPIEIAQDIRAKQNKKISTYDVQKFVELFESIMKNLNIEDYRIIIPKEELEVNYGIWIMFTK